MELRDRPTQEGTTGRFRLVIYGYVWMIAEIRRLADMRRRIDCGHTSAAVKKQVDKQPPATRRNGDSCQITYRAPPMYSSIYSAGQVNLKNNAAA